MKPLSHQVRNSSSLVRAFSGSMIRLWGCEHGAVTTCAAYWWHEHHKLLELCEEKLLWFDGVHAIGNSIPKARRSDQEDGVTSQGRFSKSFDFGINSSEDNAKAFGEWLSQV